MVCAGHGCVVLGGMTLGEISLTQAEAQQALWVRRWAWRISCCRRQCLHQSCLRLL